VIVMLYVYYCTWLIVKSCYLQYTNIHLLYESSSRLKLIIELLFIVVFSSYHCFVLSSYHCFMSSSSYHRLIDMN